MKTQMMIFRCRNGKIARSAPGLLLLPALPKEPMPALLRNQIHARIGLCSLNIYPLHQGLAREVWNVRRSLRMLPSAQTFTDTFQEKSPLARGKVWTVIGLFIKCATTANRVGFTLC